MLAVALGVTPSALWAEHPRDLATLMQVLTERAGK